MKNRLRASVRHLQARGLQKAATWSLEQIIGIESADSTGSGGSRIDVYEGISDDDVDKLMLARSLLDAGEYQRCAFFLQSNAIHGAKTNDSSAFHFQLFLTSYARYMAGEKLKDQLRAETSPTDAGEAEGDANGNGNGNKSKPKGKDSDGSSGSRGGAAMNSNLRSIYRDLLPVYRQGMMDGFALYIFAVVVRDLHRQQGVGLKELFADMKRSEGRGGSLGPDMEVEAQAGAGTLSARQLFIEAIQAYPWNWWATYP